MSVLSVLLLMWLVTFIPRWLGLSLGRLELPPFWLNFMTFVPISVIAALIVPDILTPSEWGRRLIACGVGGFIVWKTRNLGLSIIVGYGVFLAVRALGI